MDSIQNNNDIPRYTFRPMNKFAFKIMMYYISIWILVTVAISFIFILISTSKKSEISPEAFNLFMWVFLICTILTFFVTLVSGYMYTNSMEFNIYSNEVVVRKGLVNKTEKHVPFRTITNISSRYGVYDRLLGMGTVEIETAGKSGASSTGPEEKIEGIENFKEVRNIILEELRKFRSQYVTGTEVEEIKSKSSDDIAYDILTELKEIKKVLSEK